MDGLTIFGFFAVGSMALFDSFERVSHWFSLAFAFACFAGAAYAYMSGTLPFAIIESVWGAISLYKWYRYARHARPCP